VEVDPIDHTTPNGDSAKTSNLTPRHIATSLRSIS
jgi:hypothetical protein